jgi:osmotically-inducible protein OsmY
MRNPVLLAWAVVVCLTAFCGGCASSKANKETQTEEKPALRAMGEPVEAGETPSNETIGFEIRRRLNDNPSETAGIIVEVDEGRVTLRGTAPTPQASWRAEGAARSVKGVKQVVNQIQVVGGGRGAVLFP